MVNTLDVTISGEITDMYVLPNDSIWSFNYCTPYFKAYETPTHKTLNLVNIESFEEMEYPIVQYVITEKPYKWFKRFWFSGTSKLYNVERKELGTKKVTWVKMRSGEKYMIDESAMCIQNALDACVWTADLTKGV